MSTVTPVEFSISKVALGLVVPIPIFPFWSILNLSTGPPYPGLVPRVIIPPPLLPVPAAAAVKAFMLAETYPLVASSLPANCITPVSAPAPILGF